MTDEADKSLKIIERENTDSIARQAAANAAHETPFEIEGKRVCLDCYDPIARKRLAANPHAVRCTECQNDHDRRAQRGMA